MPHLRDELDLSYSVGGLHLAAFAAGSMVAGLTSSRLELAVGRQAAALVGGGACSARATVGLTAGRVGGGDASASILVMGFAGGLLLATIQATLADRHGELSTVALTEANVAASVAYVVLIGAFSLAAALGLGLAGRAAGRRSSSPP